MLGLGSGSSIGESQSIIEYMLLQRGFIVSGEAHSNERWAVAKANRVRKP